MNNAAPCIPLHVLCIYQILMIGTTIVNSLRHNCLRTLDTDLMGLLMLPTLHLVTCLPRSKISEGSEGRLDLSPLRADPGLETIWLQSTHVLSHQMKLLPNSLCRIYFKCLYTSLLLPHLACWRGRINLFWWLNSRSSIPKTKRHH